MLVPSWNIRGLNCHYRMTLFVKWRRDLKPWIILIQESKFQESTLAKVKRSVWIDFTVCSSLSNGKSNGLPYYSDTWIVDNFVLSVALDI